jgi:3-oxoacyl-[acyl-carrier protein] reductase
MSSNAGGDTGAAGAARRNALVTGASRGIGAAIAEELARAGCRVFVNFREDQDGASAVVARIRAAGGEAEALRGDVSVREDAARLFATIEEAHGPVHHLVNNAGVTRDGALMLMSDAEWSAVLDTNLGGTYLCSQIALRGMMLAGGGAITNIVSPSGVRGQAGQCNYSAAKGAVIAFTKALAREMGRYAIRVNAVCPGVIATGMAAGYAERRGKQLLEEIALRRLGQPADVAPLVAFLGSEAAAYITAQVIAVDGGLL